jgi:hypothetical protein
VGGQEKTGENERMCYHLFTFFFTKSLERTEFISKPTWKLPFGLKETIV